MRVMIVIGAVLASIVAYALPSPLWVICLLPIWAGFRRRAWKGPWKKLVLVFCLLLLLNRLLGMVLVIADTQSSHAHIAPTRGFVARYLPVSVGCLADISYLEPSTRRRFEAVAKGKSLKMDPFTGEPLRKHKGVFYSVGPDLIDQGLEVHYDPTNGTFSSGDVPLGEWR